MGQGGLGHVAAGGSAAEQACADRQSSQSSASGEQQLQPAMFCSHLAKVTSDTTFMKAAVLQALFSCV